MATPAKDRLDKLLKGKAKPAPPDSTKPHIADDELQSSGQKEQQPWQIPKSAQYPRKAARAPSRTGRDLDQLTSSDDDDYVAAFQKKPEMKSQRLVQPTKSRRRVMPEPEAFDYPKDAHIEPLVPLKYLPKGKIPAHTLLDNTSDTDVPSEDGDLPAEDAHGNKATGHFCILQLVAKFPYRYMVDRNDRVSRHFFADNKFYNRTWDIYYIDPPGSLFLKPILLLSYQQVKGLIDDIARTFKIDVSVPSDPFTLSFFEDGTPQPKFLGSSTNRDDIGNMQDSIPPTSEDYGEPPPSASLALVNSFEAYKAKTERAHAASKKKSTVVKKKKANDRLLAAQDWVKQLKRVQRYFGLRPRIAKPPEPDSTLSWAEQEQFRKAQLKKCRTILEPLDVNKKVPFPFDQTPVIVSVDVESYERAHHRITEIGVSTLDTEDLVDRPPGEGGEEWIKQIRSRHFRIKDNMYLRNKEFCIGNPDAFDFGTSEFVALTEAADAVDACFEYPFSVAFKHGGLPMEDQLVGDGEDFTNGNEYDLPQQQSSLETSFSIDGIDASGPTNTDHDLVNKAVVAKILGSSEYEVASILTHNASAATALTKSNAPKEQKVSKERKVLLLGHDIGTDLAYLEQLGSQIFSASRSTYPVAAMEIMADGTGRSQTLANIVEALDTAVLYRVFKKESQTRSLANVLADLGRCGQNLHNAGNDARYTLEALIALVIKARLDEEDVQVKTETETASLATQGSEKTEWEAEKIKKAKKRMEDARREALEECEAWETAGATGISTLPKLDSDTGGVNSRGVFATSLPIRTRGGEQDEKWNVVDGKLDQERQERLRLLQEEAENDPYLAAQLAGSSAESSPVSEKQYGNDEVLSAVSAAHNQYLEDGGTPVATFSQFLSQAADRKQGKSTSQKRREAEMAESPGS